MRWVIDPFGWVIGRYGTMGYRPLRFEDRAAMFPWGLIIAFGSKDIVIFGDKDIIFFR